MRRDLTLIRRRHRADRRGRAHPRRVDRALHRDHAADAGRRHDLCLPAADVRAGRAGRSRVAKWMYRSEPWNMVEVFLLGVLVSLLKTREGGRRAFRHRLLGLRRRDALHGRRGGGHRPRGTVGPPGGGGIMSAPFPKAADRGLAGCHTCGRVSPVALERCPRCGIAPAPAQAGQHRGHDRADGCRHRALHPLAPAAGDDGGGDRRGDTQHDHRRHDRHSGKAAPTRSRS